MGQQVLKVIGFSALGFICTNLIGCSKGLSTQSNAPAGSTTTTSPSTTSLGQSVCTFTLSTSAPSSSFTAVPMSAFNGQSYPCTLTSIYNKTENLSSLVFATPVANGTTYTPISNTGFFVTLTVTAAIAGDIGLSPGILLASSASNTNTGIPNLLSFGNFDPGAAQQPNPLLSQVFENLWIGSSTPAGTMGAATTSSVGDFNITISSAVISTDNVSLPNGSTGVLYSASGSGSFHLVESKTGTTVGVNVVF